jgi:hypothetical protein
VSADLTDLQRAYLRALLDLDTSDPVAASNVIETVVRSHRSRDAFLRRLADRGLIEQAQLGTRRVGDLDRPVVGYVITDAGRVALSGQA